MTRIPALLGVPLAALALAACGTKVSTSSFKGEQQLVAQTIANLQSDATAGEEKKICADDLAAAVVTRLGGAKRCESTIKSQLSEIDSLEVNIQSIKIAGAGASASVKSTYEGKTRPTTVSLVKEAGKWKIAGL
jgi:hypothetical protein